jgi:methylmalonyl-CoA mutase
MPRPMFSEFSSSNRTGWLAAVSRELEDESRLHRLVWHSAEGFDVQPIYFAEDLPAVEHMIFRPGEAPFVRGASTAAPTMLNAPVLSAEDPVAAASELEEMRCCGLRAAVVQLQPHLRNDGISDRDGVGLETIKDFRALLFGGTDPKFNLTIEAGESSISITLMAAELSAAVSVPFDPWTMLAFRGNLPWSDLGVAAIASAMLAAVEEDAVAAKVLGVHADLFHDAGATSAQELACALACGLEWIRLLSPDGCPVDAITRRMRFRFAVGVNFFMEVAKLRAARMLWSKVAHHCGAMAPTASAMDIHAVTSRRYATRLDPWVNIIRNTVEVTASSLGGAAAVTIAPHDALTTGPTPFSSRIARNIHTVLDEEAYVGRVTDPVAGSYYVETLTETLARQAWTLFQDIERAGGFVQALRSGMIGETLRASSTAESGRVSSRRIKIIGTNQYPHMSESSIQPLSGATMEASNDTPSGAQIPSILAAKDTHPSVLADAILTALREGARVKDVSTTLQSAFPPRLEEKTFIPLKRARVAEGFERLRQAVENHSPRPVVFLAGFGPGFWRRARATFSSGFFGIAGFEILDGSDHDTPEEAAQAAVTSGASIVVICSDDDSYSIGAPLVARTVKEHAEGALVIIAGKAGIGADNLLKRGVDFFIHMESDAGSVLEEIVARLGIRIPVEGR